MVLRATQALRRVCNVSLDLPAGAMVGIVSESRSGKSMLIRLLLGLIDSTERPFVL